MDAIRLKLVFTSLPPERLALGALRYKVLVPLGACGTVSDVESLISQKFGFSNDVALTLAPDGFVVLATESARVFENGDEVTVSVQQKPLKVRERREHGKPHKHQSKLLKKLPRTIKQSTSTKRLHSQRSNLSNKPSPKCISSQTSSDTSTSSDSDSTESEKPQAVAKDGSAINLEEHITAKESGWETDKVKGHAINEDEAIKQVATSSDESDAIKAHRQSTKPENVRRPNVTKKRKNTFENDLVNAAIESKENAFYTTSQQDSKALSDWLNSNMNNLAKRHASNSHGNPIL